ncbi:MAG: hypothetical protein A2Z05_04680 [Chloroflexi bacterium RBG_16_60_22]|nr:MAG: hypothetical protein A2Z05_04680 [Chloroflexi bacterium RBG_16_60_22]
MTFRYIFDGLAEATNGLVTTEYLEAGVMGAPTDTYNRMTAGIVDVGVLVTGYYPGVFQMAEIFELPIHYPDSTTIGKAIIQMLKKGYFDKEFSGMKPITIYGLGPYQLMSTKAVSSVADFKGMKLRGPSDMYRRISESLGGVPVQLAGPELFTSMDKGIIDATWAIWEMARAFRLQEVTKYTVATRLSTSVHVHGMNLDAWAKLPDVGKKYLSDNFDNFILKSGGFWDGPNEDVHQLLLNDPKINNGELSAAEQAKLDAILAPIVEQWVSDKAAKGLPAKQAVTDYYNILVGLGVSNPFVLPK